MSTRLRKSPAPVPRGEAPRLQRGIQSVEVGGQLLRALAHQGRPMALKDLAREAVAFRKATARNGSISSSISSSRFRSSVPV